MVTQYVLGVDHGSGSCKTMCLDSKGNVVDEATVSYPSYYSHPRWVEQDPEDWINAAVKGIKQVISSLTEGERNQIKGISFTAPAHVAVLLNEQKNVLRNVIMWNDQRSGDESKELSGEYGELIYSLTNHYPTPTWTISHLYWLMKHEPEVFDKVDKVLFEKDYVRYRFSGEMGTDYIEAEGSMLYDVHKQEWSDDLLSILSLDKSILPSVYNPTDQAGTLTKEMAERLGLSEGIPIIMGTTDTAAEVYGSGAVEEGDGVVKIATAGNFSLISKERHVNKALTSYSFVTAGLRYQNSGTNFAASSYRWFKETFFEDSMEYKDLDNVYAEIDKEVSKISIGSEGLLFHPYLNGERSPHWDPYLRGSFFGITARHNRYHFARAVLEGVAFSIKDAGLEFPQMPTNSVKIIGGGGNSLVWSQILADILNVRLEIPKYTDAAFGSCLIATCGIGWYDSLSQAVNENQFMKHEVFPNSESVKFYESMFSIYKDFHKQTKLLSHRINELQ
ncbi:xylulokinase [Lentibacillus amyloliquefaciens]|nr:xylulokinase [Lentibacillus amyloliquefaciens]